MKYKIKKRSKINLINLLLVVTLSFCFMSRGYSYFTDALTIRGTTNIKPQQVIEGASTYELIIKSKWQNGGQEHLTNYTIEINVLNNDGDFEEWEVNFDVTNGLPTDINCWTASITTITGNNVNMHSQSWNGNVPNGTSLNLGFNITIESQESLQIENFKFNGKTVAGVIIDNTLEQT